MTTTTAQCAFWPLEEKDSGLSRSTRFWVPFDVDVNSGRASGLQIYTKILPSFTSPPQIFNVSSEEFIPLRRRLENSNHSIDLNDYNSVKNHPLQGEDCSVEPCLRFIAVGPLRVSPLTGPPLTGPPLTGPPLTGPPLTGPPLPDPPLPDPPLPDPPLPDPPLTRPLPTLQDLQSSKQPLSIRFIESTEFQQLNLNDQHLDAKQLNTLFEAIKVKIPSYDQISMQTCRENNIEVQPTSESNEPQWIKSFKRDMTRRRDIPVFSFEGLLSNAKVLNSHPLLYETIHDCFVCNDNAPRVRTSGQNEQSCTTEVNQLQANLIAYRTPWEEKDWSFMFKCVFKGVDSRTANSVDTTINVIASKNMPLPGHLGVPVVTSANSRDETGKGKLRPPGTYWYKPRPDSALLRGLEPYLLVEFESPTKPKGIQLPEYMDKKVDYARMLLYGASLVRWINRISGHHFILPLLYVYKTGNVDLLYMYELNNKIHYIRTTSDLNGFALRLRLFVTIFNIIDREPLTGLTDKLRSQITYFKGKYEGGLSSLVSSDGLDEDRGDLGKDGGDLGKDGGNLGEDGGNLGEDGGNLGEDDPDGGDGAGFPGTSSDDEGEKESGDEPEDNSTVQELSTPRATPPSTDFEDEGDDNEDQRETGKKSGSKGRRGRKKKLRRGDDGGGFNGGGGRKPPPPPGAGGGGSNAARTEGSKIDSQKSGRVTRSTTQSMRAQSAQTSKSKKRAVTVRDLLIRAGYIKFDTKNTAPNIVRATKKSRNFLIKNVRHKRERIFYDKQVKHPNIIKPEEVICTRGLYLVILPELVSFQFAFDSKSPALRKLWDMSHDLAKGLQFLHDSGIAHMDIKPSNLVYHPKTFVLQIIDFNLAVYVEDLDMTVSGRRGTSGWMAPEVWQGIPFKPILADRFSCGVVFNQMANVAKEAGDHRLVELDYFSLQLRNSDPSNRPALSVFIRKPLQQLLNC